MSEQLEKKFEDWFRGSDCASRLGWRLLEQHHYPLDPEPWLGAERDQFALSTYTEAKKLVDAVGYDVATGKQLLVEFKHGDGSGPDGLLQLVEYWFMLRSDEAGRARLCDELRQKFGAELAPTFECELCLVLAGHVPNLLEERVRLLRRLLDVKGGWHVSLRVLRFKHDFGTGDPAGDLRPDFDVTWAFSPDAKAVDLLREVKSGLDELLDRWFLPPSEAQLAKLRQADSGGLCEKEKQILFMYYDDKLTMKEIGVALGLSEASVGQILAQVVKVLRRRFAELDLP